MLGALTGPAVRAGLGVGTGGNVGATRRGSACCIEIGVGGVVGLGAVGGGAVGWDVGVCACVSGAITLVAACSTVGISVGETSGAMACVGSIEGVTVLGRALMALGGTVAGVRPLLLPTAPARCPSFSPSAAGNKSALPIPAPRTSSATIAITM